MKLNLRKWLRSLTERAPAKTTQKRFQVADWLPTHTFHHSQFADLKALVVEKERQNLRISLCLPALNEEKTIGKEIIMLKSELMKRYPLLDELVVIDSGSTDQTREIAASFGASVYLARDILPQYGEKHGKGENLWKALYQMRGDIIIYIDADITNIRPHLAYGLVGPLIRMPEVQYVKAFYDRPLTVSKGVRVSGGGRVTEIQVRPLFSLFFPELTAIIQPLSGEYAARRRALERLPFPVGYGVETAHLLDIYHRWGMAAFAQTDLDQRIHRNQSTHALGKMAFGIYQTFFRRWKAYGCVEKLPAMETMLRQFQNCDGRYEQTESLIREVERPPIITIPEYQKAFGRHP